MNVIQARPVRDFSFSCFNLKRQTAPLKSNCFLKPKLKLKRPPVVPSIHGDSIECYDWRSRRLEQLIQQGSSFSSCNSRIRRKSDCWRGIALGVKAVSILAQESRPFVKLSGTSSLAVSLPGVGTKKDGEHAGIASDSDGQVGQEGNVCDREKLRRHRISIANKGRVPWNKGGKHSPETIERIRQKTFQAMNSPQVLAKLRLNPRHSQTDATKVKIGEKLREKWEMKKRTRGYQEIMLQDWKLCVAEAARKGGLREEEMEWNSYFIIKKKMRAADIAASRSERKKKIVETAVAKVKERLPGSKSEEHRMKISAAIRAKWEDPEYQKRVRQGMSKNVDGPKQRKTYPRKKPPQKSAGAGVVRDLPDDGFIAAVMSGENKRSRQKELADQKLDGDGLSMSPGRKSAGLFNRKVNILKRTSTSSKSLQENTSKLEGTREQSVSTGHSFVDPLVKEKLLKLNLLQASRSLIDEKRREAAQRARTLLAEAETASKVLEETFGNDEFALASLVETRRLMAEAVEFMQKADSFDSAAVSVGDDHNGALENNILPSYQSSKLQLQIESDSHDVSKQRQDDNVILSPNFTTLGTNDHLQSGQEPPVTNSKTIVESAQVMLFCNEAMEKAPWDIHSPFIEESDSKNSFPSSLGLLNGTPSRGTGEIGSEATCKTDYSRG